MEYKTRKEAKQNGECYYFLGKECPHGHVSKRRVSNGACFECEKEKAREYRHRPENTEKVRQWAKSNYEKHKHKRLESARQYRERNKEYIQWVRQRQRHWIAYIKIWFGCTYCGYNKNSYALDFNHIKPGKVKEVSSMVGCAFSTIVKEIRKCEVLCANCHREYTAEKMGLNVLERS